MDFEVIDDLLSDDPYAALSARQGKVLREMIEDVAADVEAGGTSNLELGETATTAYRGDQGKIAYDHSQNGAVHVTEAQKTDWDSKADGDHTHTEYAEADHTHTGFAASEHTHEEYADADHTHSEYASTSHYHTGYASSNHTHAQSEITGLTDALADKADADHTHSDYASSGHTHSGYASSNHTHDEYADVDHTHSEYFNANTGGSIGGETNVNGVFRVQGQQMIYYNDDTDSQTFGTNNATGGTTICCGPSAAVAANGALFKAPTVIPRTNNTYYCGNANFRWKGIYSTSAVNVSSDERMKRNIVPYDEEALMDFVNGLNVVSYNYKSDAEDANPRLGLIAQDVQRVDSEIAKFFVSEDDTGMLGLKPADLVFPLIAAVQILSAKVEELSNK